MGFDNAMWHLDQGITGFFGQWNAYSSALVTLLLMIVSYQIFTRQDPDTHPMLLARQAQGSPVRQEGESPVFRSHAAPHGMPLNSGLNVKDAGASKWARGRDGDLRDVWRRAINGAPEGEGPAGKGRILTVLGREKVLEHSLVLTSLDDVTRQINLVGQHIMDQGGNRVAIYLPNSVELMATLFACSFYNLTAIILPFDKSDDAVISMLRRSAADTVIAAPGSFPFDSVVKTYPSLRQLIWVVDEGSKHMDWNEVPKGMGGSVNVSTWQEIVQDQPVDAGRELPPIENQTEARDVTVFWQGKPGNLEEMVRFTSANLVSAVAAQIFAVPTNQRMNPSDLFLPADSLANTHTLVLTLAAIYSNASVAFNSVAEGAADLALATQGIAPTIVVATPRALLRTHAETTRRLGSFLNSKIHWLQTRSLTEAGVMPAASFLSSLNDSAKPAVGTSPGKLRILYTAERVGAGSPPISSAALSDLRVYTGARVIYALTAPKVAGAIAQTGYYDYRVSKGNCSHFGPPLTSTEIFLKDRAAHRTTDDKTEGEVRFYIDPLYVSCIAETNWAQWQVVVRGPCVAGNETAIGMIGRILDDNTLAYA
ncbi:uncharacterized protein E0L32_001875 [Thyridium curvatum]|uniref:AMP-dependent synthetase/ligase domain-containing protein n=1 Tax=Thyridium curvatum TaxID=1093900 RepID=A0A507AVM8_9PEZI|nr:uncharacterized protein E0L32_001804 [Thyridium curvatum]XP_030990011.1 uncharacterized protein E0L32_001875 [Thyridium curvatum]TPX08229.1 hypothetical protein E0L32_001804 [Thyridium curvatum]TPX08300.1 hypothetical protein E0L32_001875 [Thyridium curvatum]